MQNHAVQFKLVLAPSAGKFVSILFSFWIIAGVLSAIGAAFLLKNNALSVLLFPVLPFLLTILLYNRLMATCTVRVDENGFSMDIAPGSLMIKAGLKSWRWDEVLQYKQSTGRWSVLIVRCADERPMQLSGSELDSLYQYLKTHFPEKKKTGWW
ncbi:MAG: hypothetical protein JNL02_11705 [Saprospiraceae bacterium]|nr:hypothetical protein [Saprospiraceae bacterium]